jgi:DNA-binding beta-propeller fold protein YncE
LFSAYEAEKDAIVANYAGIFLLEGISYYVRQTAPLELSLLAGSGTAGSANGTGAAASFNNPEGMARDPVTGNIYVADSGNHVIRKITPAGVVTTIAGSAGVTGAVDAIGSAARFNTPVGLAWGNVTKNLFISDSGNHTIRYLNPVSGAVTTLSGSAGISGSLDGTYAAARFNAPQGLAIDPGENFLIVADRNNNTVRRIGGANVITLAGTAGLTGSTDATGAAARFYGVKGVALDASLNVYVSESINATIRKITPAGVVSTIAGLSGVVGSTNGTGAAARFSYPWSIASDGGSNLYVADTNAIRKVTTSGVVTTVVGTSAAGVFIEGLLPSVLGDPNAALVSGGQLYISTFGGPKIAQVNGVP